MAARGYLAKGDKKNATRVLKKAWEAMPHPDLAAAFAEIEPEESPKDRLTRFKALTSLRGDSDETKMLLAELLVAAEDFPAARRALGDVATRHPTQRSLAVLAAIARGEGAEDAAVRAIVAQAITAPRGPQWCCDKCQTVRPSWHPVCENCGSFDSLSWREPTSSADTPAGLADLLPLLQSRAAPEALTVKDIEPEAPDEILRRAN